MRIPIQSRTGMRLLVSPLGQCWSQFFGRCVGCRAALIMAVRPQHSIIPPFTSDCANAGERDIIGHCNVRATCNIAKLPWSPGGENGNWFAVGLDVRSELSRSRRLSVARTGRLRSRPIHRGAWPGLTVGPGICDPVTVRLMDRRFRFGF